MLVGGGVGGASAVAVCVASYDIHNGAFVQCHHHGSSNSDYSSHHLRQAM